MVKAHLERRNSRDPNESWWLELNGVTPAQAVQLDAAIENNVILQHMLKLASDELVIDFSHLKEFDSHGLLLLLRLSQQFSPQNIQIVLHNPSTYLSRVLRIMQFDRVFKVEINDGRDDDERQ